MPWIPLATACSVAVLWSAGLLGCTAAWAQPAGTVLPPATVPVLRGVVSGQVIVNAPTPQGSGALLKIDQTSSRAIIDWKQFNIGSGSEVRFHQPGSTASVLNRIYSADPSLIQGRLSSVGPNNSAGGQIVLVNQNGIYFDRGSQVNAYSLIASTLNISNEFFNRGLLSGDDPGRPVPAFAGAYALDGDGSTDPKLPTPRGAIVIGAHGPAGAAAPLLSTPEGGSILMFAPTIENRQGLITAPDGQVILAAGHKVYLSALDAANQGLRGFLVEVSADKGDVNLSSLIRNQGEIRADRGNITLQALALNQEGRVAASTAVLYNGSVWLKASSKQQDANGGALSDDRAGTVTLGAGSVTATPLDLQDKTTLAESQAYASSKAADDRRGRILISGATIDQRGSIEAPGGYVSVTAGSPTAGQNGRIYLAEGSRINAAGHWADVAYDSNFATFRVTSNELKDAPDQKDGLLKGATVTVDLRKSSGLLDISGYVDGRRRTVGEKASTGGTVELKSSGDVIQRPGSVVDVSGGGYRYAGGNSRTTQLMGDDGKVYGISSAPKTRTYVAQLDKFTQTFGRWGQTKVFDMPFSGLGAPEAAYVEGRSGGQLDITAPRGLVLDGQLRGGATTGPTQLTAAPAGATLTLGTDLSLGPLSLPVPALRFSTTAVDHLGAGFTAETPLPAELEQQTELAAQTLFPPTSQATEAPLEPGRFGRVIVNSRGRVEVPAEVTLNAGTGTALSLRGVEVNVAGTINTPAGTVLLQGIAVPGSDESTAAERVTVHSGATISTAGLWRNLGQADGTAFGPLLPSALVPAAGGPAVSTLNGGSIQITGSGFDVQPGSTLDASGGGTVDKSGRITAGSGGSLSIAAEPANTPSANRLAGDLSAYSLGGGGGRLSVSAPQILVGGSGSLPEQTIRLDSDFFGTGGFSSWSLSSQGSTRIAEGTLLRPTTVSRVIDPQAALQLASGSSLAGVAHTEVLRDDLRPAASFSLASREGALTMDQGSAIVTDARGRVALGSAQAMTIDGRIEAPAGAITLTLNGASQTAPVLTLGSEARLVASGAFAERPAENGLRQGSLLDGGSVELNVTRGAIVTQAGSVIDVSGTSRRLALPSTDPRSAATVVAETASHAGSIVLRAQERSTLGGNLIGQAGSSSHAGGSLAVELSHRTDRLKPGDPEVERRIVLSQSPLNLPAGADTVDLAVAVDPLKAGGFDKLRLQSGGRIEAQGEVDLALQRAVQLDSPELRLADGATLKVQAASVVLANAFGAAVAPAFQGTPQTRNNNLASRPVATRAGTGRLDVQARTLDVVGDVTLNGSASATLAAEGDLRLSGRVVGDALSAAGAALKGSLVSAGDLTLTAAQVLPTTRSEFTVAVQSRSAGGSTAAVPGGRLTIAASGQQPGDPLSAGGQLTLRADTIEQGGTLRAPLGQITLDAGSRVSLLPGSLTSVSAEGLTIPYGNTVEQRLWLYGPTNASADFNPLSAPPAKAIDVKAPVVDLATGARVDVSGGGDIQALEFVPGNGGSTDTLLKDNTYAILPAAKLGSAPVDRAISNAKDLGLGPLTAKPDALAYDSLHIGPGAAVPEGDYVLLPGRYALLPGAHVVTLQTGTPYANLARGQSVTLANGQLVVPGYRQLAGTAVREEQTIGVVVRPGTAVLRESDYVTSGASFFANAAERLRQAVPTLPADGGRLSLAASTGMRLDGQILTTTASDARAAQVDLAAPRIAIVAQAGSTVVDDSYLQLEAARLSQIGGSLLIGGTRSSSAEGTRLQASASEIVVATEGTALQAPELLLAATDRIHIRAGSQVKGSGSAVAPADTLLADAQGALLRVASGADSRVDRGANPGSQRGSLTIEAGATVSASGSMALDATRTLRLDGTLDLAQGSALTLATQSIRAGAAEAAADTSLVLGDAALRSFDRLGSLTLKGHGSIELAGTAAVGAATLGALTLDTPLLRAAGDSTQAGLAAQRLTLTNTGAAAPGPTTGAARLTADAGTLVLGAGDKALSGFGQVELRSRGDLIGQGSGRLLSGAATTLQAARITAAPGSDQAWRAEAGGQAFEFTLAGTASSPSAATAAPAGGRLAVEGRSVALATAIVMPSGQVTLAALGPGQNDGVSLGATGSIDVSGHTQVFADRQAGAAAGSVTLTAAAGTVNAAPGSTLNLAGASAGGDAGRLQIRAASVQLAGTLRAQAAAGSRSGQADIDVQQLADFSGLNKTLAQAGFNEQRHVRSRSGDLKVQADDLVQARDIRLQADTGRIDVEGRLDASGVTGGGSVALYAGTGLRLAGAIDASGTNTDGSASAAPSDGGRVVADARSGRLEMDAAASIDLRSGAKGRAGSVEFTAARSADGRIDADLRGSVTTQRSTASEAGEVVLQGRQVVTGVGNVGSEQIAAWGTEHAAFMRAADSAASFGALRTDGQRLLRGVLELQGTGDIQVRQDWDLTTPNWLTGAGGQGSAAGLLSVRAAGDITLHRSIGLPDDKLVAGPTWSMQFAAGADLAAANPLGLRPLPVLGDKGDFRLAAAETALTRDLLDPLGRPLLVNDLPVQVSVDQAAKIRTGTGRIEIAAGRDFVFESGSLPSEDAKRVIYTAGVPAAPDDRSAMVQGLDTPWAERGGDIRIQAQRDAIGQSNQWVNGWLRRPRGEAEDAAQSGWFVHRPNFQQNLGTLGGGNVSISAGRDVTNLSAALPTMGRIGGEGETRQLQVTGGGNLQVRAGRRIEGGDYLMGRGSARFEAGDSIGQTTALQLHLMGESDDPGRAGVAVSLQARTGVRLQSVDNPTVQHQPPSQTLGAPLIQAALDAEGQPLLGDDGLPLYELLSAFNFRETAQGATSNFLTASPASSLDLRTLSGDITLGNGALAKPALATDAQAIRNQSNPGPAIYPGQVSAVAFDGSVLGNGSLTSLFPSAQSSLTLLAARDLGRLNLFVSDRDPSTLADWQRPSAEPSGLLGATPTQPRVTLAPTPGSFRYDLVAEQGSARALALNLPAAARVQAGLDIAGGTFQFSNQQAEDVSLLRAVEGDVRPASLQIGGPGKLLVQAGRHIDLGTNVVSSLGNARNVSLAAEGARMIFIAGVPGEVDLKQLDKSFGELGALNQQLNDALALYRLLEREADAKTVLDAKSVADLAARDKAYERFVELDKKFPRILAVYQDDLAQGRLPLGPGAASSAATELYTRLNAEKDPARLARLLKAGSIAELAADAEFGAAFAGFVALDQQYPTLFADYRVRRSNGFLPSTTLPIVFAHVLDEALARVFPGASIARGNIDSFLTSIESSAGGGIDLLAPAGDVTVGLTTPRGRNIGVLTTAGGDIRSLLSGNFNINQGKVVTAQGGDILIYSSRGNIDAGRGARTSQTTPAPIREPVIEGGVVVGFTTRIPAGFSGSGIQTLSSDPDGQGPLPAAKAGTVLLFTPAGYVDAGEAGIVSGGDLVIVAQTVLNAANISAGGSAVGVPVAASGSLAASMTSGGGNSNAASKASEEATNAAANAARAAAAAPMVRPNILVVEVLGFGDKNCKEQDKDCFAK